MERKLGQLIPYERKDRISKVSIEPEKTYGIYLPDWNSLTRALYTFAASDYQSTAPLTKEETAYENEWRWRKNKIKTEYMQYSDEDIRDFLNFYGDQSSSERIDSVLQKAKDHFHSGNKMKLLDQHESRGVWQIYQRPDDNKFFLDGRTFHKTDVTIEALRSEKRQDESASGDCYTGPYLLNIYSSLNKENPEAIVLRDMSGEQAALPRRVKVVLIPGSYGRADLTELVDRVNNALHKGERAEISRDLVSSCLNEEGGTAIGACDGLEVKMRTFSPRSTLYMSPKLAGLEFIIGDPALESRVYGETQLIPPEKRQAAQSLAEKIRDAFST